MKITFLGGVGTVTGSRFLVQQGGTRVLVDCGLFQGIKSLRQRNWSPPPIPLAELDAVALTHAHIDHSGYLPALVRDGFDGPIYATAPTLRLCKILLPDSAYLQEEAARYANKKGFSKHAPARPLYTQADAEKVNPLLRTAAFKEDIVVGELRLRYQPSGHILGAASILITGPKRSVLFSGDLGRPDDLLMPPPADPGRPDWVVMESTYGDRNHPETDIFEDLAAVARRVHDRKGVLLIPAFAVGRAQAALYIFKTIFERGLAPEMPITINSPMATNVTKLYQDYPESHRLSADACERICGAARYVQSVDESRALNKVKGPHIIISASGMLTGGRVLHHFKAMAPRAENAILLVGFQPPGTRGHSLLTGASEVKLHGEYVPVRAEICQSNALSAHADQSELLAWLGRIEKRPRGVCLVHGEPSAADTLRRRIEESLRFPVTIPEYRDTIELD